VCLASLEGVCRCVSSGSRRILSVVVFGGSGVRSSTFVCLKVGSFRSATVVVLVRWSYGDLARQLPDCLVQDVLHSSGEGGAMAAARLWLSSVLVVIASWFKNLNVIFIISDVRCTIMIENK